MVRHCCGNLIQVESLVQLIQKISEKIKQKFVKSPNFSVRNMTKNVGTWASYVQQVKKYNGFLSLKVQSENNERVVTSRARKMYERYLKKFSSAVTDDETYYKSNFSSLPGQEFYTSKKKNDADKQYFTQKTGKFPKQ